MKLNLLPLALSLGLLTACGTQSLAPTVKTEVAQTGLTDQLKQASVIAAPVTGVLSGQVNSRDPGHDNLVFRWQPPIKQTASTFKTQAVDLTALAFVRLSVTGPGIPSPIFNSEGFVDISGGTPQISISNIPKGKNRVITAQFYDATQVAVGPAVAYGIYSTGVGNLLALAINRRQRVAAEVLLDLASTDPNLAENIDVTALQAALDPILYGINPVGGNVFAVDPSLFNPGILAADLITSGETLSFTLDFNSGTYRKTVTGLDLNVTGLIASVDTLKVQVEDPTSTVLSITTNGPINLSSVLPGDWPVSYKLEAGTTYTGLPEAGSLNFGSGINQNIPVINLVPAQPELYGFSVDKGPRGTLVELQGDFFHQKTAGNQVFFENGGGDIAAEVISASKTKLVVRVPQVPTDGNYNVRVEVGSQVSTTENYQVLKVWHVATDGNALSNGADWASVTTLQNALQNAQNEDEIWLKAGTYLPDASDRNISFVINTEIALTGGFAGTELSKNDSNALLNPTILSGDLLHNDNPTTSFTDAARSENSLHVLKVMSDSSLNQLTIQGGHANGGGVDGQGGGIYALNPLSSFRTKLTDVKISGNTAVQGGGFYAGTDSDSYSETQFYITRGVVENNQAQVAGGGGLLEGGSSEFISSFFNNNQAAAGGAIQCEMGGESRLTLDQTVFTQNTATAGDGGALNLLNSAYATLSNSVFYQNHSSGNGGGANLFIGIGHQIYNLIFSENEAGSHGGGLWVSTEDNPWDTPKINNSVFYNNQAPKGAGLWFVGESKLMLQNNIWVQNNLGGNTFYTLKLDSNLSDTSLETSLSDSDGTETCKPFEDYMGVGPCELYYEDTGNHLVSDPLFVSPQTPLGLDGKWFTADDGFGLKSTSPAINSGANFSKKDILNRNRPNGGNDRGAYEMP